mmetsp:Transcript_14253/g.17997  ORF Transcript_14253/g.17997 Transcript_14253/m.17997 type:complete len:244 (-) Transcript_14253:109-840(-)
MASSLCCNPIQFDDEMLDMELEEVWEVQRSKSRDRRSGDDGRRGRPKKKLMGTTERKRRGLSISRDQMVGDGGSSQIMSVNRRLPKRSMSTGRMGSRGSKKDRSKHGGKSQSARANLGRDSKKVSISKYVERIDLQERQNRNTIAPPIQRKARSNSMTRAQYEDKNRFNTVHLYNSFDERDPRERSRERIKPRRRFSFRRKKKDKRQQWDEMEEWSSSSSSEDEGDDYSEERSTRGGFLSAFR